MSTRATKDQPRISPMALTPRLAAALRERLELSSDALHHREVLLGRLVTARVEHLHEMGEQEPRTCVEALAGLADLHLGSASRQHRRPIPFPARLDVTLRHAAG